MFYAMLDPVPHKDENKRLQALRSYDILDTLPEKDYDNLTALASQIAGTKVSLISLVDEHRQWFKSAHGLDLQETQRRYSFCAHAINAEDDVFQIPDARKDNRFKDNPLVTSRNPVIFYAGVPLETPDGLPLGSLCVIDAQPRTLNPEQRKALKILGHQVENLLELRRHRAHLKQKNKQLHTQNEHLERFATLAAHDLKSPLQNIEGFAEYLKESLQNKLEPESGEALQNILESAQALKEMVSGLLRYSRSQQLAEQPAEEVDVNKLKHRISTLLPLLDRLSLEWQIPDEPILIQKELLERVLLNLLTNAIKYSTKENPQIRIELHLENARYRWLVCDDGPGIPPALQEKIFDLYETGKDPDRFGKKGTGMGLPTVRRLLRQVGGDLLLKESTPKGSCFEFYLPR